MAADFKKLIEDQVSNAFEKILKPGNLTVQLALRYMTGEGVYNAEEDITTNTYETVAGITAVLSKPTFGDVKERNVVFTDGKLIVPGAQVPREPDTTTDRAVFNGRDWNIRKTVGVPGQGIYILFVNL